MYRPSFIPSNPAEFDVWFKNFVAKLAQYTALFSISATEYSALQADSTMVSYAVYQKESSFNDAERRKNYLKALLYGDLNCTLGAFPVSVAQAAAPAAVLGGVMYRLKKMITRIKNMLAYNESIGSELGIWETTPVSMTTISTKTGTIKPYFVLVLEKGRPMIKWKKGPIDGIDIYVDRNDGNGFVMLYGCNRSKYIDMSPLPKVLTNWTYKIIYRKGVEQYGLFSDPSSIAVIDSLMTSGSENK